MPLRSPPVSGLRWSRHYGLAGAPKRPFNQRRPRTERRRDVQRNSGLGPAVHLDWNARPQSVRYRHMRCDGDFVGSQPTQTRRLVEETSISFPTPLQAPACEGEAGLPMVDIPAVVPTISGRAWLTQHCQVVLDPSDPFPKGYTVGDIWSS
mmetsp:Transcript_59918/g.117508  ORF Transcript_59918/g.117508 Transcript_59918/m.117508 type:complete len:151 (+) Transcript_59918:585-1037(+)